MSETLSHGLGNMLGLFNFGNQNSMDPLSMLGVSAGKTAISGIANAFTARGDRKHQLKMWRLNNEYNHPSEQMARLRKAGLNPNLMYGQGTVGNSPSPAKSTPTRPPAEMDALGAIMTSQQTKQMEAQTDNLRAQNTLLTQEKLLNSLDMLIKGEDYNRRNIENQFLPDTLTAELGIKQGRQLNEYVQGQLAQGEYNYLMANQDIFSKYLESKYMKQVVQNEGQEKINALRDLEIMIKNDMKDFTQSNQVMGILTKIATILKGL